MSSTLRPLAELSLLARLHNDMVDITLPSLQSWSDSPPPPDPFSSPPRSSSPPRTPYHSKHPYDYPHIQSSPRLGYVSKFSARSDHYEDSHAPWHQVAPTHMHSKSHPYSYTPSMSQSTFTHRQRYSVVSDFDSSEYSENIDTDFDDVRSDFPSHAPTSPLSDTHTDDRHDSSPGFSFSELGIYTMSFRTSAERGRWKSDPISYRLPTRKSAPATKAVTDVLITSRPISEPAPSFPTSVSSSRPVETEDRTESFLPEVTSAPSPVVTLPSLPTSPALGSMDPLPPLTSDRDSSMDVDELPTPSSPLPPSSPPPFSPAVSVTHLHAQSTSPSPIYSRSSSPLTFAAPSSPLSPCSSEIGEGENDVDSAPPVDKILTDHTVVAEVPCEGILNQDEGFDFTPTPHDGPACAASHTIELPQTDEQVTCPALPCPSLNPSEEDLAPRCTPEPPVDDDIAISSKSSALHPLSDNAITDTAASFCPISPPEPTVSHCDDTAGSSRKRQRTSDPEDNTDALQDAAPSTSTSPVLHEATKRKAVVKKRRKDPLTPDAPPRPSTTFNKQRKKKIKHIVEESNSEESESESGSDPSCTLTSRRSSPVRRPPKLTFPDDGIQRDQNGIAAEDGEICGMIIEGMATSRASSLPISQIYKIVMQSRPSMKADKDEKEWRGVFDRVLKSGTAGFGSGVFGKVDSSYKDEHDPAVEARWFYVPEMDCDKERAALIRSMMPRPGKRNVTKKYKQYYYQPLDKISRWDPEDDL